jgi:hypothetical protein
MICNDLDFAVAGTPLQPHVSYKLYCDHLYSFRTSPAARAAVRYHVKKLKSLADHTASFWPPLDKQVINTEPFSDIYRHIFPCNNITAITKEHPHLSPSLVVKSAVALFLMTKSKGTHAIFGQMEGARDVFPFLSNAAAARFPYSAGDVGGQTLQPVLNHISLDPSETCLDYLNRLQVDAHQQTKYAAAPLKSIMADLDPSVVDLFPDYLVGCRFNWLGTNINRGKMYKNLDSAGLVFRPDARFAVEAVMERTKEGDSLKLTVKARLFPVAELEGFAREIEGIIGAVTRDLGRRVVECLE